MDIAYEMLRRANVSTTTREEKEASSFSVIHWRAERPRGLDLYSCSRMVANVTKRLRNNQKMDSQDSTTKFLLMSSLLHVARIQTNE